MPARISVYCPAVRPTSTSCGMILPPPMSTNTTARSPVCTTADVGTVSVARVGVDSRTVAYIPGFSRPSGFGMEIRALSVRASF